MAVICGHVYCLHLPIAAKEKLLVPAFIQDDHKVRFFVINTERTEFQIKNPDISKHVITLPKNVNRRFLTHDSWLSCHEFVGGWTVPEIDAVQDCYRGTLDSSTLISVRNIIEESRLYSAIDIAKILGQWPQ